MNILVVGRGGREHSIVIDLAKNNNINQLYAAPGNGGIAELATCVNISEMDIDRLVEFAKENAIDLTIVGPENPLLAGIANRFQEENLSIFAPTKEAALLEGSKRFAKSFMRKYDIPTAEHASFTDAYDAKKYIETKGAPIVVKADGLAAGKGVVVAETDKEAIEAVDEMLVNKAFAEAGATVVIEECLIGKEFSLMAFVHESNVYPMIPARDHKRAHDNDQGPNTGGMGAYAPVQDISQETLDYTVDKILQKTADGLMDEGRPFTGILYAGLMMTENGPKVIEFNMRFGDPETQVVLPLLTNDLLQVFLDVMNGEDPALEWEEKSCTGVVVAAKGYPGSYKKEIPLTGIQPCAGGFVIQAGTRKTDSGLVSEGGRVLLVGAKGSNLSNAVEDSYKCLDSLALSNEFFYRRDIGKK
ncbi:phosphoribosylamine--glycine ligase [Virgibacillus subterraneus]|uniref:Phosphoribosylamine--glycine ligase n=1 Tax=Virgibacillus subterraneus TaxID=621109 RepID=A0A1H9J7R3_9BACI|nr:phosphoribosylamine--glycine ligase [Virgibacillus subterraneus]SEQ82900.1 phosphoribosylamine--glycine ligase [Virgibacillus subterraneus]